LYGDIGGPEVNSLACVIEELKTSTSGLSADILDLWLPITSNTDRRSSIETLDPENVALTVGKSVLCRVQSFFKLDSRQLGFLVSV
jgi:hypothetical protein